MTAFGGRACAHAGSRQGVSGNGLNALTALSDEAIQLVNAGKRGPTSENREFRVQSTPVFIWRRAM